MLHEIILNCLTNPHVFFIGFTKENNMTSCFLLWSFLNGVHSSRKEFAPRGANSFHEEVTFLRRGGKERENSRLELLHLKV